MADSIGSNSNINNNINNSSCSSNLPSSNNNLPTSGSVLHQQQHPNLHAIDLSPAKNSDGIDSLDTSDEPLSPLQARLLDYLGGPLPPLGSANDDPAEASLASTAVVPPISRGSPPGVGPGHQFEQTIGDSTLRGCFNDTVYGGLGSSSAPLQELRTLRKYDFSEPKNPESDLEFGVPREPSRGTRGPSLKFDAGDVGPELAVGAAGVGGGGVGIGGGVGAGADVGVSVGAWGA
eukprot:CAMPEP_0206573788 /NCGR_PEP_ID=MMETSP0325_2-20121206/29047_1 /ASSEMBLY_ACC=CAM_ASM_000347 /TAXON_ID=2866 /ORGANISM="Crypthecodinium cohnii, Strain Seligo" /LENGTH=233 /DNA_ID=CAMNT_0054078245 /DNA_START=136 /DNA_END=834 /DNA_ORIENTATION=-